MNAALNLPESTSANRSLVWSTSYPDEQGNPTYQAGPYRAHRRYDTKCRELGWTYTDPDGNETECKLRKDAEMLAETHLAIHGLHPTSNGESDEQVLARMRRKFGIMSQLVGKAVNGDICALIISGPPGIGKSHPTEQRLEHAMAQGKTVAKVCGAVSPIALYMKLYAVRDAGILLLDDADSVYSSEEALNLLKAALESKRKKRISWEKDSSVLRREGIPNTFSFTGTVIFITNLDLDREVSKGKKLSPHIEALLSRSLYLPLEIDDTRDIVLRIRHIVEECDMLGAQGISDPRHKAEIVEFIADNADRLRTLSLREVVKLASLYVSMGGKDGRQDWRAAAEETMIRKDQKRPR